MNDRHQFKGRIQLDIVAVCCSNIVESQNCRILLCIEGGLVASNVYYMYTYICLDQFFHEISFGQRDRKKEWEEFLHKLKLACVQVKRRNSDRNFAYAYN